MTAKANLNSTEMNRDVDTSHALRQRMGLLLGNYLLLFPCLALLLTFVYLPVVWAFSKSLYEFEIGGPASFVGLSNYTELIFRDPTTYPLLGNMFLLTLFAVVVRLSIPLIIAKLIISLPTERERYWYRVLFLIPIVVPGVAVYLIWGRMIFAQTGLVNEFLALVGLSEWATSWLSNPKTALIAVALVGFPFAGSFEVLIYYAGLSSIPESVNEAARLEGCVGARKFMLIDVPLVLSQIKLILILTIINGVQSFEALLVLTRGGPGFETMVPGLWMYFNAFSFQRFGYACAIGVCLFVMIMGLTLLNMKFVKSRGDA